MLQRLFLRLLDDSQLVPEMDEYFIPLALKHQIFQSTAARDAMYKAFSAVEINLTGTAEDDPDRSSRGKTARDVSFSSSSDCYTGRFSEESFSAVESKRKLFGSAH